MIIRIVAIIILSFVEHIFAIETITITKGRTESIPIAINHFLSDNSNDNIAGNDIITVINNDLKHSGLFRPISSAAFIENQKGIEHKPLFAAWRQINSNLLLNGEVKTIEGDKLRVSFVLWDTILEKDIVAEVFEVSSKLWRRVAHKIADKIYEKTTGDLGYFDTKIAYVSESGNMLKKIKRIAIMDQDGANHKYITDGRDLVLTPRFSSDNSKLLYISYARKIPRVYMYDLKTNKAKIVGEFAGMSFAPRFAHKEQKALMSIARNGSTHIFEVDLRTMKMKQLTFGPTINTSPSYSPDDSKIVFNSDRSGTRQIYIMDADGTNATRISFSGVANTSPNWSPRGDYIAFTKVSRNEGFSIAVMRPTANPEENGERIIANGYLVEGPTWASNGRVIMFAKSNKSSGKNPSTTRIYSIDLTGYNEQIIPTPKDASDPDWSNSL